MGESSMKFETRKQVTDAAKAYGVDIATAVLIVRRAQKNRITIREAAKKYGAAESQTK